MANKKGKKLKNNKEKELYKGKVHLASSMAN